MNDPGPESQRATFASSPGTLARNVVRGLFEHHAFDHAATMSFYFFLGLIPLVLVAGLLAGTLMQRDSAQALIEPLYRAMPAVAADLLREQIRDVAETRARTIAPLSVLGFVWLTTNGVHNLMDVFEMLVHAERRPWWQQRLMATGWTAGLLAVIALATWLLLLLNGAMGLSAGTGLPSLVREASGVLEAGWHRVGVLAIFATISTVGLAGFYRLATIHPPGIRRRVWPGTVAAHVLWIVVSWGFGAYVQTMAHYAIFYGSLATVAVILLWLYLTSLALLVGAEINAQLGGLRYRGVSSSRVPALAGDGKVK